MSEIDNLLTTQFKKLPKKPSDTAPQSDKKRYSEQMSAAAAVAFAEALRKKGLKSTFPLMNETDKVVAVVEEVDEATNGSQEEESTDKNGEEGT